jgi:NADH-ubiquinone oxidoreductase chain 2
MLLTGIFFLLLSNSLSFRRDITIFYSRIGMIILLYCIIFTYNNLYITYLDLGIGLFGGLFHTSSITLIFHLLIYIISLLILSLTGFYSRKILINYSIASNLILFSKFKNLISNIINKKGEQYTITEYTLILLFVIVGSVLLISSSDFVSLFLSIELQSYGLYLLSTIYRNSEISTSSGLTYFLLGGLSSCFILLGIALIYANTGTTNFDNFFMLLNISNVLNIEEQNSLIYTIKYIPYCLLLLSIGLLFKISAAPFHFWSPDVYDGIPTIVTTFVAIIAKISILILLLHLVHFTKNIYISNQYTWTSSLLVSSLLSLIIGTVLGLTQFRIKRLYAYSTISHVGFLLLALSINSVESIQSFIFYLIQYSITNLNAFILLLSIGYSLYFYINKQFNYNNNLLDKNNSPIQLISQLKGYYFINRMLALSLAITLFSFAGIPPFIGFFAKQMVLSAALQDGFIFLAIIAVFTSVISAVYYLFVIKTMFFDEQIYKPNTKLLNLSLPILNKITMKSNIVLSNCFSITISILTLVIILFMFMPDQLLFMCNILSLVLLFPNI